MLYYSHGEFVQMLCPVDNICVSTEEREKIERFILKSVLNHVKQKYDEPFSVSILFGGKKSDWSGTPLQILYDNNLKKADDDWEAAFQEAGMNVGSLLRNVLIKTGDGNFVLTKEQHQDNDVNVYKLYTIKPEKQS